MVKLHSNIEIEKNDVWSSKTNGHDWMIKSIKKRREIRNVKNMYKILLIFSL